MSTNDKLTTSGLNADSINAELDIVSPSIKKCSSTNSIIIDEHNKTYYELLINIRNFKPLSTHDLDYIKTLSKYNLIEIIKIYNAHMKNINELF